MVHGYFKNYHPFTLHMTLGHEISGVVEKTGCFVPETTGLTEGDQVVVVGCCGDGTCRLCRLSLGRSVDMDTAEVLVNEDRLNEGADLCNQTLDL
jgi:D-arabinose 1-dehydrogenase-like Zn-dependent alcohol dehydrogenase